MGALSRGTAWWGAASGLLLACIPVGSFPCSDDGECGPEGTCVEPGYCASTDERCDSGLRYSRYAPEGIAQRCVEPEPATTSTDTTGEPPDESTSTGELDPSTGEPGTTTTGEDGSSSSSGSTGDPGPSSDCLAPGRIPEWPLLLYDFCEGEGTEVASITEVDLPLAMEGGVPDMGFWWEPDGLRVNSGQDGTTALRSIEPVFDRLDPCRDGDEVTLEVWATPASESQGGPTRIVELGPTSGNGSANLSLRMNPEWAEPGYVGVVSAGGTPSGPLEWYDIPFLKPNHLVLVHGADVDTLYLDAEVIATRDNPGDLSGWNPNYDLVFGNQTDYEVRNWAGTYHLVALYCRALTPEEIQINFTAGPR